MPEKRGPLDEEQAPLLEVRGVTKRFPGVLALDQVRFDLRAGEIHALVGENGAGKSTLMKILAGAYRPDAGQILLQGQPVALTSPRQAADLGISIIYQEFTLLPALSVAENIFLSHLPGQGRYGWLNRREMLQAARHLLDRVGLDVDPAVPVRRLRVAQQQLVEVAKALSRQARVLIMDEPTAALTEVEVQRLFQIMARLRQDGVGIIYISHKLDEVFSVADRITVLRDGRVVHSAAAASLDRDTVIRFMVGREVRDLYPKESVAPGEVALEVEHLCAGILQDISFSVRRGEILGVAGLMGAGQPQLARALFGALPQRQGIIRIFGRPVRITSPRQAIRLGIGLLTENRKEEGLVLGLSVAKNMELANLDPVSRWGFVSGAAEARLAQRYIRTLNIRTPGPQQRVMNLSGGNQQKVVLSKWLNTQPEIIILSDPTRGIDVGAKAEIYRLMNDLAKAGKAVLMISSELPEILGLSDRILVLHEGRLVAEFSRQEATAEKIMFYATGAGAATGGKSHAVGNA